MFKIYPKYLITLVVATLFVSCSGENSNPKSIACSEIEDAYLRYSDRECSSKTIDNYEIIKCISSIWLNGGNGEYYAINGKARTDLEKIQENHSGFYELPPRYKVSISAISFDALEQNTSGNSENYVKVVKEETVSQDDLNAYCSYLKETDNLTVEANHKFGDDSFNSKERESWITPKIKAVEKKYFDDNGKKYEQEFIRILDSGVHCPR